MAYITDYIQNKKNYIYIYIFFFNFLFVQLQNIKHKNSIYLIYIMNKL